MEFLDIQKKVCTSEFFGHPKKKSKLSDSKLILFTKLIFLKKYFLKKCLDRFCLRHPFLLCSYLSTPDIFVYQSQYISVLRQWLAETLSPSIATLKLPIQNCNLIWNGSSLPASFWNFRQLVNESFATWNCILLESKANFPSKPSLSA